MEMDHSMENGYSSGNVVHIVSGNWGSGIVDQSVWATEDDYDMWNGEGSLDANFSNYDGKAPPSKRSRSSNSGDLAASNRSRAIGKMFYKTKLCCKFRAGTCPYTTNCNFAHSIEELRKPPPNWQEIVAAHEEERGPLSDPREEFQIPIVGVSDETQRSYKGRHCKKFYTEEGCPYGESCTFLHDEQSRARESVAISLGPGPGSNSAYAGNGSGPSLKPSNWKTRICNKWELTGYCPFGSKCHFAHGAAELHQYGGGPMDSEVRDSSAPDASLGPLPPKTSVDTVLAAVPHSDGYLNGIPSHRVANVVQKTGLRSTQKWKGPDKISKIYGDWIDDL